MLKTISKLVSLAAAALVALPAMAGDFGGHHFPRHRGIGYHQSPVFGQHARWSDGRIRFAGGYGGFGHHGWRTPLLKRVNTASGQYGNSNIIVVVQPREDGGNGGTYAGSSYAYATNGGTYVGGSGYYVSPQQQRDSLAPMAKVIDVAAKGNACSYEAGVCVIRP